MSTHKCPGGCGADVSRQLFACKPCWFRLPRELRQRISGTFRRDKGGHVLAMADAVSFYQSDSEEVTSS